MLSPGVDIALSLYHSISLEYIKERKGDLALATFIVECIEQAVLVPFKGTVTLTFGDVAESHVGMQKIGKMDAHGFMLDDLMRAKDYFEEQGCMTELIHLNSFLPCNIDDKEESNILNKTHELQSEQAYFLVVRDAMKSLSGDSR